MANESGNVEQLLGTSLANGETRKIKTDDNGILQTAQINQTLVEQKTQADAVFLYEVASLSLTSSPAVSGNVTVTLNNIATNIAVTAGVAEVANLVITSASTVADNVTVTLNSVATTVAVLSTDTAIQVADKIRATTFTGWATSGTIGTTTVVFTSTTVGIKTDAIYSAGTTGATGTMTTTTQGIDADTTITVATKIRNTVFTGWTNSGTVSNVIFTSTTSGNKIDAIYSAGNTGATGAMTTTVQGTDPGLTFSANINCVEIYNTDTINDGIFIINGINVNLPKDKSFKSVIGGIPSTQVSVVSSTSYIISRYI